jgi:L-fuculose-phosphate aldolase
LASSGDLTEDQVRREIVRYCALLWDRRLVTGTSGNVSMRLADGDLIVTPSQRALRALDEAELVRTDPAGMPRNAQQRPTSELPLHVAAYGARDDITAIVHTHPTFCVVWSKTGTVFPRDTVGARETMGEVAWTPYAAPGSQQLANSAAVEFRRGADMVLMERHGLSAVGSTLEKAFVETDLAEEAARIAFFSKFLPSQ